MTAEHLIKSIADIYTDCLTLALEEARKNIASDSMDLGTLMRNASWSAYCEGLEQALMIVNDCTAAGLKQLAERKAKDAGLRSLQDPIKLDGADMNSAYPKVQ